MSNRLADITRRKQALVDRATRERVEVAQAYRDMRSSFALGGAIVGIGRTLKAHPMIAAGISSLLVSGPARGWLKSAGALISLWRVVLPFWNWWNRRRRAS